MSKTTMKNIGKWTLKLLAGVNVVTVIIMLIIGNCDFIHPQDYPILSTAGLFFPFSIAPNLIFLFFWLIVKWRYAAISFIGLLLAYSPIRSYFPLNIKKSMPEKTLKVVSFNTFLFALSDNYNSKDNSILNYLKKTDADIICLQEAETEPSIFDIIKTEMGKINYQVDTVVNKKSGNMLMVMSKYKILNHEKIEYHTESNVSAAFNILIDNDTVTVINNHLESTKLTDTDKRGLKTILMGGLNKNYAKKRSLKLLKKLALSNWIRGPQADSVSAYIKNKAHKDIIVCGDFNDNPCSYTLRVFRKLLTDCYRESGNGPGYSYNYNKIRVRIDHIFCSDTYEPIETYIDKSKRLSDHYPVVTILKKR